MSAPSSLSQRTTDWLKTNCPMRGRKLDQSEEAYLAALSTLTPGERQRLQDIPWTNGETLSDYERSVAWRIEQVVEKKVPPRRLLRRLEKHWGRSLLSALPD